MLPLLPLVYLDSEQLVSWMNIGDEASGAHLQAIVYPVRTVAQIDASQSTQDINKCFERWGLPEKIKIDNGRPFVNPHARKLPTLTILWWIGLGIEVIQNPPKCPQDNGTVEKLQGTLCSWSNPKDCKNIKALQKRLNEESDFQRNHYRIPSKASKAYKTRLEIHPELEQNKRVYNSELFDIQKVYDFLAQNVWVRTIRKKGDFKFNNSYFYIGKQFAHITVFITFDPIEKQWLFRQSDGTLIKTSDKYIPSAKQILDFANMSKN